MTTESADRREPAAGNPADHRARGVFVLGSPRSGTSALSWSLAAHERFWTSAESDYLVDVFGASRLAAAYQRAVGRPDQGWLATNGVGYSEFASAIGRGVEHLFESHAGGRRWVDSTPGHTLMAETLAALCPSAKFLHIVRDGRSVVNSMIHSGFEARWATHFGQACCTWRRYVTAGRAFVRAHPERALEVRHEDLVARPEAFFDQVFGFLGEEPSAGAVRFARTRRINSSYGNKTAADVRQPKDPATAPVRPWENWTPGQRALFRAIGGPCMVELGYEAGPLPKWAVTGARLLSWWDGWGRRPVPDAG